MFVRVLSIRYLKEPSCVMPRLYANNHQMLLAKIFMVTKHLIDQFDSPYYPYYINNFSELCNSNARPELQASYMPMIRTASFLKKIFFRAIDNCFTISNCYIMTDIKKQTMIQKFQYLTGQLVQKARKYYVFFKVSLQLCSLQIMRCYTPRNLEDAIFAMFLLSMLIIMAALILGSFLM